MWTQIEYRQRTSIRAGIGLLSAALLFATNAAAHDDHPDGGTANNLTANDNEPAPDPGDANDNADADNDNTPSITLNGLEIDLIVPESPAFTVLGLTPNDVVRPSTPRELAVALQNGIDRNGNFQTGVALDFNPWLVFNRNHEEGDYTGMLESDSGRGYTDGQFTLARCLKNPSGDHVNWSDCWSQFNPMRALVYRTQLSLATAKGTTDQDESFRVAGGIRVTPFDNGDPIFAVGSCMRRQVQQLCAAATRLEDITYNNNTSPNADRAAPMANAIAGQIEALASGDFQKNLRTKLRLRTSPRQVETSIDRCARLFDGEAERACAAQALSEVRPKNAVTRAREEACRYDEHIEGPVRGALAKELKENIVDPLTAALNTLDSCYAGTANTCNTDLALSAPDVETTAASIKTSCESDDILKETANKSSWTIGYAPSWIGKDGSISDLEPGGGAAWTSLAMGWDLFFHDRDSVKVPESEDSDWGRRLKDNFQAIIHARYTYDELTPDTQNEGNFIEQDSWLVGGRLNFIIKHEWGLGLAMEGIYKSTERSGMKDENIFRYSLVPAFKISDDFWLEVSFGGESGADGNDEGFVLTSVKFTNPFADDPS